jgi:hypothetical protein
MKKKYVYKGKVYLIGESKRKNKEYVVKLPSGKKVHFADPKMPEFPGTKRGDNYCTRSKGIGSIQNTTSANFWSRQLWSCRGKKSISKKKFFGKLK